MSAKVTELYMVLGEPGNGRLVAKVWLERAGDLYVTTHAPVPMAGKWSHHASGMSHQDVPLIRRRIGMGEPKSEDLRNIREFSMLKSVGSGKTEVPDGYVSHGDTKIRKSLILSPPSLGWFFQV